MAALFFAMGCDKEKDKIPVDFKFRLLDTLGNESTVFNEGENIIFSFEVINNSSEDVYLKNFFPNHDFFRVYQPNTDEGILDYGTPYEHLFCEYIGALCIPKNSNLKIVIPWYNNKNYTEGYIGCPIETFHRNVPKLKIGNFYTEFSQSFKIEENQTEEKHFKINFTIK